MANPTHDVSAAAFFNIAREYQRAANQLLDLNAGILFSNPIGSLYFHAAELVLKAFLRSHGCPILGTPRKSHRLRQLYDECQSRGLKFAPGERAGIETVMNVLEAGNEGQKFRYFNLKSRVVPRLAWTREAVDGLMRAVESRVGVTNKPGPAVKMDFVFSMTRQKR
jgi:hypothetical protein